MTSPSCLFCVSDTDKACMRGIVEVTLLWGGEESMVGPSSDVVVYRWVSLTSSAFPIRLNVHDYPLPTRWSYMLREYGACSGMFRLPAVGSTAVVEAPIDWGSVEAFRTPSERCESLVTTQLGRQVARVTPQWQTQPFSDVERCCLVSCSNKSQSCQGHHRRHCRASRTRADV